MATKTPIGMVVEEELRLGPDPARGENTDHEGRPDPSWIRGTCPACGDVLVSNLYYCAERGYRIRWECWSSLLDDSACTYREAR